MQSMHVIDEAATPFVARPEGRRELKIKQAKRRVERAAIELALEHGVDNVTVDAICEASDISARTFYNYFGAKEAAMVGVDSKLPSDDEISHFIEKADGAPLEDFLRMLAQTFLRKGPDIELVRRRRELLASDQHLASMRAARFAEDREAFADIIGRRLARQFPDMSAAEVDDEALIAVAIATGVLHVAGSRWLAAEGTADLDDLTHTMLRRVRRLTDPCVTSPHSHKEN